MILSTEDLARSLSNERLHLILMPTEACRLPGVAWHKRPAGRPTWFDRALLAVSIVTSLLAPTVALAATSQDAARLLANGKFGQAERRARSWLASVQASEPVDSSAVADAIDQLCEVLRNMGKGGTPEARALSERAVRIREGSSERDELKWASSAFQLGCCYLAEGDYPNAKTYLSRSLEMREKLLGPGDPAVATSLLMMGAVSSEAGDHVAARPLLQRSLAIRESYFAAGMPPIAECLNAYATILVRLGDYAGAEPVYERAMSIWKKAWGGQHARVATCLNNLSTVLYATGNYERALAYGQDALKIRKASLGASHPWVATTRLNIGMSLAALGRNDAARKEYREAIRIRELHFGAGSPEVGTVLKRLGDTYLQSGEFEAAQPILRQAVANLETLGQDHPDLAEAMAALATTYSAMGDTTTGGQLQARAIGMLGASLGPSHPEIGFTMTQYGRGLLAAKEFGPALEVALQGETISRRHLQLMAQSLPEETALAYSAARPAGGRLAVSILSHAGGSDQSVVEKVWDALVRSRCVVLDEIAFRNRLARGSHSPEIEELLHRLTATRRHLANLTVAGPQGQTGKEYRTQLERSQHAADAAEREVARSSSALDQTIVRPDIGLGDVSAALPENAALVSYALVGNRDDASYVAFLRVGKDPSIHFHTLGNAKRIDRAVESWLQVLTHEPKEGGPKSMRDAGLRLRQAVWDPITSDVGNAVAIFIVPDGSINLMSFAALPAAPAGYLVESGFVFHYLAAERDLVPVSKAPPSGRGLLALGDPDFGKHDDAGGSATLRGVAVGCASFQSVEFQPLPNTGLEVRDVARAWSDANHTVVLTGAAANEAAFKALAPGRRVIHLATHGFFLEDDCVETQHGSLRGIGATTPSQTRDHRVPAGQENPLHLSGLALAGANERAEASPEKEDGILTAEEISTMNLVGTEWAVLSACDTGKGRVQAGEGVLGLRRAFQSAGAASVIMSLWPVDDKSTRQWMDYLYQGRVKGLSTADAVRDASLRSLRERRAHARNDSPFYWASFVAAGDWR